MLQWQINADIGCPRPLTLSTLLLSVLGGEREVLVPYSALFSPPVPAAQYCSSLRRSAGREVFAEGRLGDITDGAQ